METAHRPRLLQSMTSSRSFEHIGIQRTAGNTMNRRSLLGISAITTLGLAFVSSTAIACRNGKLLCCQPWDVVCQRGRQDHNDAV
jgi:uncharacterized protein (DUF1501 family)